MVLIRTQCCHECAGPRVLAIVPLHCEGFTLQATGTHEAIARGPRSTALLREIRFHVHLRMFSTHGWTPQFRGCGLHPHRGGDSATQIYRGVDDSWLRFLRLFVNRLIPTTADCES